MKPPMVVALTLLGLLLLGGCNGRSGDRPPAGVATARAVPPTAGAMESPTLVSMAPAATPRTDCVGGNIKAAGSTAIQPLVQTAADRYQSACPQARIAVEGGGSITGLRRVAAGEVDLGDSDLFAEDVPGIAAEELVDHQIVRRASSRW